MTSNPSAHDSEAKKTSGTGHDPFGEKATGAGGNKPKKGLQFPLVKRAVPQLDWSACWLSTVWHLAVGCVSPGFEQRNTVQNKMLFEWHQSWHVFLHLHYHQNHQAQWCSCCWKLGAAFEFAEARTNRTCKTKSHIASTFSIWIWRKTCMGGSHCLPWTSR